MGSVNQILETHIPVPYAPKFEKGPLRLRVRFNLSDKVGLEA